MKMKRIVAGLLIMALLAVTAACGKEDASNESGNGGASATEMPVDIVSHVADGVTVQTEAAAAMDDGLKKNYIVLLDGCSDEEAGYYLYDITGDGIPELILGTHTMTVYSYNQGAVMTIGTLEIQEAWLDDQYGFVASCQHDGRFELRRYQYDGEMFAEEVLVSADSEAEFDTGSADYLKGARTLKRYELTDRSEFDLEKD